MYFLAPTGVGADTFFTAPLPKIAVQRRVIVDGDERGLLPAEALAFAGCALSTLRRSGAARIAARELFRERYGLDAVAIPRAPDRSPIWPPGFVGSLAHDETTGVAAVARASDFGALGVDVEPNEPLGADLVALVATPAEIQRYAPRLIESRLLFVIKEAVYKALYALDGRFLEFHDVEVDLERMSARTAHGHVARFRFHVATEVAALAFTD